MGKLIGILLALSLLGAVVSIVLTLVSFTEKRVRRALFPALLVTILTLAIAWYLA